MRALKSVKGAAGLLGLSHWTVRKDIREGNLKVVRIGRRVLIEEEELERFVAERRKSRNRKSALESQEPMRRRRRAD